MYACMSVPTESIHPTVTLSVTHCKARYKADDHGYAFEVIESIENLGFVKVFKVPNNNNNNKIVMVQKKLEHKLYESLIPIRPTHAYVLLLPLPRSNP